MQALFQRFAETGWIKTKERFRNLGKVNGQRLWEFKSHQLRFLGALGSREFVVAHAFKKKQDRHRQTDLERAARVLVEHSERETS